MPQRDYPTATSPDYKKDILALRKNKRLHSFVEDRLIELVTLAAPGFFPIKEPQGLPGGRNDLMLFEFRGRSVVFELFATASQVSRDLLILHKTLASVKIAIIIDQSIDGAVLEQYLRQNPSEPFPFLFTGEIFATEPNETVLKIREIVSGDEDALFRRMLRTKMRSTSLWSQLKRSGIDVIDKIDIETNNITYAKVFTTLVLSKCLKLGVRGTKLNKLASWLSNDGLLRYIGMRVKIGLNMFLYTDFAENIAIYSDIELVDWIRAGYNFSQAFSFLSMNAIIEQIETEFLKPPTPIFRTASITMTIGSCQMHETKSGRVIVVNMPSKIRSVIVTPPAEHENRLEEYQGMIHIATPGETIKIG